MSALEEYQIGGYNFLASKNADNLFRPLSLSYKYQKSSLYRYSLILVSFLENRYFARGISMGNIVEETDIAWVAKDYCADFTVVASHELPSTTAGDEVHYIRADFRTFRFKGLYDLVVIIGESFEIMRDLDFYIDFIRNHTYDGAEIIFMIRFYPKDRYIDPVSDDIVNADAFVRKIPFRIKSKFIFNIDDSNDSYTDYFFSIDKP